MTSPAGMVVVPATLLPCRPMSGTAARSPAAGQIATGCPVGTGDGTDRGPAAVGVGAARGCGRGGPELADDGGWPRARWVGSGPGSARSARLGRRRRPAVVCQSGYADEPVEERVGGLDRVVGDGLGVDADALLEQAFGVVVGLGRRSCAAWIRCRRWSRRSPPRRPAGAGRRRRRRWCCALPICSASSCTPATVCPVPPPPQPAGAGRLRRRRRRGPAAPRPRPAAGSARPAAPRSGSGPLAVMSGRPSDRRPVADVGRPAASRVLRAWLVSVSGDSRRVRTVCTLRSGRRPPTGRGLCRRWPSR